MIPCKHPVIAFLFFLFALMLPLPGAHAQTIYALSTEKLLGFDAQNPGVLTTELLVTGVLPGHQLMAIDFRPATGQLYALGYNSVSGAGEIYIIDPVSGVATPLGAPGINFGPGIVDLAFDFNPTVDRMRVVGSNGLNLRLHPATGALVATDGMIAYAAADANAGMPATVGTVAYTNSYAGATSTTLYDYDYNLNVFATQNPPNNGILNTVGASGLTLNTFDQSADLDIWFDPVANTNRAFFAANTGLAINDDLYTVNLSNGSVSLIGTIGSGFPVRDIAVLSTPPVSPIGDLLYALTTTNNLISFDAAQPDILTNFGPVSGIAAGQAVSGLDFRPATGELYTLGYNSTTGEARLYTLNLSTAAATAIGTDPVVLAPGLDNIGFDFNPTVDRIRVTASNNANYRLHPVTGALAFTDASLAFAAGDVNAAANPSIGTSAYTNSFNGSTATTLYNYDDALNVFTTQNPPNNGTLNTVGASGLTVNLADPSSDLDIYYDAATTQNRAYFAANVGTSTFDNLYTVDLGTGTATLVGQIGLGVRVADIAAFIRSTISLSCPANVVATAPAGASTASVTYTAPTATTTCPSGGATTTLQTGPASGGNFPAGATTVTYQASDACGNTASCSFTVTVNVSESVCDVKSVGCIRFEMLGIRKDGEGDEVYRIRVVNNCASPLNYVAFEVPGGITPVGPANNSTYEAGSGNDYFVRNPNFSPFYSVRFKSQSAAGIANGQEDIFEYTLPAQADLLHFYAFVRLSDGTGVGAHLNTFDCAIQPYSPDLRPAGQVSERGDFSDANGLNVYPNPSSGAVFVDLGDFASQPVSLAVLNSTGQLVFSRTVEQPEGPLSIQLPEGVSNGLYFLRAVSADGERQEARFVVQR